MLFATDEEPSLETVTLSRRVESMPALPIEPDGPLGDAFLARGCIDFHDAVRHVRDMPWGRPSDPSKPLAVLDENKGTATDKHMLLAALARELGDTELQLVFGIYRMSADSHPAAAALLRRARLESLPEAMVWLRWYGGDYDFSSMRAGGRSLVVLQQELITLDKVPGYVEQRHKDFLVRFLLTSRRDDLPGLEGIWNLRSQCLDAIVAEEERERKEVLQRQADLAEAEENARERAVKEADEAAREAERKRKEAAKAEVARKEAYEAEEARRKARLLERAKARAAKAQTATNVRAPEEDAATSPAPRKKRPDKTAAESEAGADSLAENTPPDKKPAPSPATKKATAESQVQPGKDGRQGAAASGETEGRTPTKAPAEGKTAGGADAPAPKKPPSRKRTRTPPKSTK